MRSLDLAAFSRSKVGHWPAIDREHPLAAGLVICIPYTEVGATIVKDIAGVAPAGLDLCTLNPSSVWNEKGTTVAARPVAWSGSMLSGGGTLPPDRRFAFGNFDSFTIFHHGTTSSTPTLWYSNQNEGGAGTPEWEIDLTTRSCTLVINLPDPVNFSLTGTGKSNLQNARIAPNSFMVVRDVGKSLVLIYVDGYLVASATDTTVAATAFDMYGGDLRPVSATGGLYNGRRVIDMMWKGRALGPAEAHALHLDPLQLLMPVRRMWFAPPQPQTVAAGDQSIVISAPVVFQPQAVEAGDQSLIISAPTPRTGLHPGTVVLKVVAVEPIVVTPFADLYDIQRLADLLFLDSFDVVVNPVIGGTFEDLFDVRADAIDDFVDTFTVIPQGLEDGGEIQRPAGQAVHA